MSWDLVSPTALVIAITVLLLGWYFVGTVWNRRRSRRFVRGLAKGFAGLGPPPKIQWLGTSAFQVLATTPPDPFTRLGITVVLEPREMLLVWLVARVRGRRDLLVIRGEFERQPRRELELFDPATPTGQEGSRSAAAERWVVADAMVPGKLRWAYPATQPDPRLRWEGLLQGLPLRLQRLSVRPASPHLLLSLAPPPGELPGELLLERLLAIGREAVR